MALVQCHECGKSVSSEAKKCPSCGASVKLPKPPKRPISKLLLGLLVAMGVGTVAMFAVNASDVAAGKKAEAARVAAMTPEQIAQAKAQKDQQDAVEKAKKDKETQTLAMALMGAKTLKKSSKDPQTFEFTSIVTHPNSSVCYEYRAKNSFNAMLAGDAVLVNGKLLIHEQAENAFVKAWNKNCTPADGSDVTSLVVRVLESS